MIKSLSTERRNIFSVMREEEEKIGELSVVDRVDGSVLLDLRTYFESALLHVVYAMYCYVGNECFVLRVGGM